MGVGYTGAEEAKQLVIDQIQGAFPLVEDPYGALAERLGLTRTQVLQAVCDLREEGTIRRLGASFSSKHLGYRSTLCAIAAVGTEADVDRVAAIVSAHPSVTHNYLREDRFNIWFTPIAESAAALDAAFSQIVADCGVSAEDALNLPATALYKIRVDFGNSGQPTPKTLGKAGDAPGAMAESKSFDRGDLRDVALVRWAQGDVCEERPFEAAASFVSLESGDSSVSEQWVLGRLRTWQSDGTLRRFGAMVQHRKMGYGFNGMTVWRAPADCADAMGRVLASFPHVSHCYARPAAPAWPYNLYAMTHAKSREALNVQVAELEQATGLAAKVLLSVKEYKKVSPVYFGS